ncbi:hypothetical protein [Vibrio cincinnatiensis]|uniref:hypothetical protein n=1 Tax=Vibrio cincinnatiensis TaxID=675 RepID=UPI001EDE0A60|nr:hypothetical protein [Vibrio cincinnatiensis]MCG3721267.1 hypothetical protein [Vibrio cincinnatiensis]
MTERRNYRNCSQLLLKVVPHNYAVNIQTGLDIKLNGLKSPERSVRMLSNFLEFLVEQDVIINTGEELSLLFHTYQDIFRSESQNELTTVQSDLLALRQVIISLQLSRVFPKGHLAPVIEPTDISLFASPENDSRKVLGELQLPHEQCNSGVPIAIRVNVETDEFLESLITNIRKHRNTLLHVARSYLKEANNRLKYTEFIVQFIKPTLFDDPDNLTISKNEKGQRYSLFGDKLGELARINLIAFLHHKNNGLITNKFKGNFNLSRFGGTSELREFLGLSTLSAVAAQIIIIIESGINVSNLRNAEIRFDNSLKDMFRITDEGFNIIYEKLRAQTTVNKQMLFIDDSDINIKFAFDFIIEATKRHRSLASEEQKKFLFIHDSMIEENTICKMSDHPFKTGIVRLLLKARSKIVKDPSWCEKVKIEDIDDLLKHSPNAKQLRVSEGILRWYDSGGNPISASNYLGNTESVAIKNYIPKELQAVLYSQQISKFQHLLLAAATDKKSYQQEVLHLCSKDPNKDYYQEYIEQLDALNPNWRKLLESSDLGSKDRNKQAMALIMNPASIKKLFIAFELEKKAFENGIIPDEEVSLLGETFKNLVSFINSHGKGDQKRMIRDTILEIRGNV